MTMRLAGFGHVFRDSVEVELAAGLRFKVVPPPVLALLKMASYLDDPYGRAKDLIDIRRLLRYYERDTDRVFSDEVFAADLPDVEFASAFLLGLDLGIIATADDTQLIERFLTKAARSLESAFRKGLTLRKLRSGV
jgi:predicted nucleotidyltransferase